MEGGGGGSGVGFALRGIKRTEGGVGHCAFGQVGRGGVGSGANW